MIPFVKMSGSGNDFILIDNREGFLPVADLSAFARSVCRRKVSVGADGLVIVEPSASADFRWRFYNADGSEAEMCGNGGRCVARFAVWKGISGSPLSFETKAGLIDAEVREDGVKLRLTDPRNLCLDIDLEIDGASYRVDQINTGVPHAAVFVQDIEHFDVFRIGRALRRHERFQPAGTNANFIDVLDRKNLRVRTYERGVEDETLACGTGAVASALIAAARGWVESPVRVRVQSGEILMIHFTGNRDGFREVYLEGPVRVIYEGALWDEAWR